MGIVSSIGNNTQEVLASLREGKSGISRAEKYAELGFRCQVDNALDALQGGCYRIRVRHIADYQLRAIRQNRRKRS